MKGYQPKIKNVRHHSNDQGNHTVVPGKIVLLHQQKNIQFPCISSNLTDDDWRIMSELIRSPRKYYYTIIISEVEEIEIGDKFLYNNEIHTCKGIIGIEYLSDDGKRYWSDECYKILALPNQISKKQLKDIVNAKLRGSDRVFVKCFLDNENAFFKEMINIIDIHTKINYSIYLDHQNSITLFPRQISLELAMDLFAFEHSVSLEDLELVQEAIIYGVEWAQNNKLT